MLHRLGCFLRTVALMVAAAALSLVIIAVYAAVTLPGHPFWPQFSGRDYFDNLGAVLEAVAWQLWVVGAYVAYCLRSEATISQIYSNI